MVVIDAGTHSEHVQVFRGDFRPGSVERLFFFLQFYIYWVNMY
jgi:hypothetical protein